MDADSSLPDSQRYGNGRTPAHEVPTDTWPEKPPTLATAQVLMPFHGGHRLVAQDVVVPPVLTSQKVGENPDALAITLGQQTQQLSRQANERSPHRPDLPKTDPAADHESTQQRRLQP